MKPDNIKTLKQSMSDFYFPLSPPPFMRRAQGAMLFDDKGRSYIDFDLHHGALIFGHAHRNVVLGVKKTVERGIQLAGMSREEILLAHEIAARVSSVDKVLFVPHEHLAIDLAIDTALRTTSQKTIAYFDDALVSSFRDKRDVFLARMTFNDTESVRQILARDDVACVVMEPVITRHGVIAPREGFLEEIQALCRQKEILLIFDETRTGFRTHAGCVQSEMDIYPDLTCFGGVIGGGLSLGALGGRRSLMDNLFDPARTNVYAQRSWINPVVTRAGLATIRMINDTLFTTLNKKASALAEGFQAGLGAEFKGVHLARYNSIMSVFFQAEPVYNLTQADDALDERTYLKMRTYFLTCGLFLPPAAHSPFGLCLRHGAKDVRLFVQEMINFFISSLS